MQDILNHLKAIPGFDKVQFVIVFGSQVTGKATEDSDVDVAVYMDASPHERQQFCMRAQQERFDVHSFQDLPLYIQKEVLQGKVIYAQGKVAYDVAYETLQRFEEFSRGYYDYIGVHKL